MTVTRQPPVACDTVTVRPATVTVVERAAPVFGAADSVTLPLPLPDAPWLTVSHGAALWAVHEHPLGPVTLRRASPPPAGTDTVDGSTLNVQGAPCCVMSTRFWLTSTAPVRAAAAVFAAAAKVTVPGPWPFAPPVIVIHPAWLVAVHEHSRLMLTETDPLPPSPGGLSPVPDRLTAHFADEGPVTFVEVERHPAEPPPTSVARASRAISGAARRGDRGTSVLDRPL